LDEIITTAMNHNSLRNISIMFPLYGYSGTQFLGGNGIVIVTISTVAGTHKIRTGFSDLRR
jgi:hypothetical protein